MAIYKPLRVAIVYDWLDSAAGAERVLVTLAEMYPRATFFTSYFDPEKASWAKNLDVRTSFIQRLPNFIKKNRKLSFFLYPYAFESFNFDDFDIVISVTSLFAKSIITKPYTIHICYLLTPPRYLWIDPQVYLKTLTKHSHVLKNMRLFKSFKKYDYVAARRPDHIFSISQEVQNRVRRYYDLKSDVLYPPFDLEYWTKIKLKVESGKLKINSQFSTLNSQFYLVVSRLEPYKRVDIVVKAFNKLNKPLVIVGRGTMLPALKSQAGKNITFLQDVQDEELGALYQNAQALIMPQEEEFGYTAVEAQFFGCPVIALSKGGVREIVKENKTGLFFDRQTPYSLYLAIERFEKIPYNLHQSTRILGPRIAAGFDKKKFMSILDASITSRRMN